MSTDSLDLYQHSARCKNCDTPTTGNFCQQCGQASHLHVPSAREFLHEFIAHYVALEGKLWCSLKLLLFKPGFLSREYIEGRRVRYVEPLRLYLSFSIIFFALFKMSAADSVHIGGRSDTPPAVSAPAAAQAPKQDKEDAEDAGEFQDKAKRLLGQVSPRLEQGAERFFAMPEKERDDTAKRVFFSYTPYAIFLMMPVFAFYLKLLYLGSGRRYGEHFLFALHSNGFAFFMLSLFTLANGWNLVRFALLAWLVFYLPTAMRRVYGGGRGLTALRWIVLMVLHLFTLASAVTLAVAVGLLL